jgi:hypothetical protein
MQEKAKSGFSNATLFCNESDVHRVLYNLLGY